MDPKGSFRAGKKEESPEPWSLSSSPRVATVSACPYKGQSASFLTCRAEMRLSASREGASAGSGEGGRCVRPSGGLAWVLGES